MKEWKVVKSISDKHPEFGEPLGQILFKSLDEAKEFIKNSEFKDLYIEDYEAQDDYIRS